MFWSHHTTSLGLSFLIHEVETVIATSGGGWEAEMGGRTWQWGTQRDQCQTACLLEAEAGSRPEADSYMPVVPQEAG